MKLVFFKLVRVSNELRLAQRHEHCSELRQQIASVEEDISQIVKQMATIDFTQINKVC